MDADGAAPGGRGGTALVRLARAVSAASRRRPVRVPGPDGGPTFADDDLPGFLASPPGTPPAPAASPPGAPSGSRDRSAVARPSRRREVAVLLAAAVAVLLLSGVAVAVVRAALHPSAGEPATAPSSPSPASLPVPAAPVQPSPGDPGAGALAGTDLPVGPGVVAARLAAAGLVLRWVPAGVTAGFPRVSLTASSDRAVVHLELPTANCLSSSAPAQDAGCQPVSTEYADLPTPSLRMSQSGDRLTFWGRFPTYLHRSGAPPVWTGRTRQVTVTVDLPSVTGSGPLPAAGSVTIDGQTAAPLPDPGSTTVTYGR